MGPIKSISDERMVELAHTKTTGEIAAITGYSYYHVLHRLKKLGVKAIRKVRLSDSRLAELAKTRTLQQIADATGYNYASVANRLRKLGVKAVRNRERGGGAIKRITDEKMAELAETKTINEISGLTGYSYTHVSHRLKALGLKAVRQKKQSRLKGIQQLVPEATPEDLPKIEIAKELSEISGFPVDQVFETLKADDPEKKDEPVLEAIDDEVIAQMRETGRPYKIIAQGLGISVPEARRRHARLLRQRKKMAAENSA